MAVNVLTYDETLLKLLFRSGLELNPGPNTPPETRDEQKDAIEPKLAAMAALIIERGRKKQKGGARRNAGRGGQSKSLKRDSTGNSYNCSNHVILI